MAKLFKFRWIFRHFEFLLITALIVAAAVRYYVYVQAQSLEDIRSSGYIRVLISDEPDSQYVFNRQHYGFEYELLSRFAKELDVELKLEVVPFAELFSLLESGAGDLAVGGIIDNPYIRQVSQPTDIWYEAKTTIVYQRGTIAPKDLTAFEDVQVPTSARYYKVDGFDQLQFSDDHRSEYQLLSEVASGNERFAFTTNYRARNAKHYLPNLNRSFMLPDKLGLVWALPRRHDPLFLDVLNGFLARAVSRNIPTKLAESYFGRPKMLSTFGALAFQRKISEELPELEYRFRRAARRGSLDWTLLAAISYQESRWLNEARSPTGVRGIMQMTQQTAASLGVTDRMDMSQSINAAARYLAQLRDRLPERIKEPERTWFAVGAYNVGYTHIMNAYRKAREQGLDRSKWQTISDLLPTLYGKPFANGVQAVKYVKRVQIFTDILRFYDLHQRQEPTMNVSVAAVIESASSDPNSQ